MAEEAVVEPVVEPAQPAAEPAAVEPAAEPAAVAEPEPEPHALEPGGKRFKEIYARAKSAETRMQEERELRIAAETEARILRESRDKVEPAKDEKVLSWVELKQLVADQKLTEAEALEYREKVVSERAAKAAEQRITSKLTSQSTAARIDAEIGKYKDAIPDVNVPGTEERKKFDTEFRYQVEVLGQDPKALSTQAAALRAVYGSPDKAVAYAKARASRPHVESYQETSGGGSAVAEPAKKSFRDTLSPREREHYERMIKHGRYGDPSTAWARIKEEHEYYHKVTGR